MISTPLNFPATPYPLSAVVTSCVRTDTMAPVAATITGSGASWVLQITEPAPNLTYQYLVTFSFSGGVQGIAQGTVSGTVTTPVGYYTNYNLLVTKFGSRNLTMWSNQNNDDALPNYQNIALGISTTDSQINNFWNNGPYNVPLTPISLLIQDWANDMAAYYTYLCRGLFQNSDEQGNQLKKNYQQAMSWMSAYKGNSSTLSLGVQRRWPTPTAPTAARGFR